MQLSVYFLVLLHFKTVFSQQPIKFPLVSISEFNNQTGCSIKTLEKTLQKWARHQNDTLVAYDCHDKIMNSNGFITPKNAQKRNNTIMFQKSCSFKCSSGYRFYNKNRELKGRKKMIKVFCNSWNDDKRTAKWRILEKYEDWSCKFRGSEGLGVLGKSHVRNAEQQQIANFYPQTLIPMATCAFKDFLKKNNAMAVNRILISSVRNWRAARFGPYDILSIQQSSIHEEREHRDPAFNAVYSVKSIHNSSLIYRKDRLKLRKTAELIGHENFKKYYGVTLVAMHFRRLHTYPGMMRDFSVLLFRSQVSLREFDLAPFLQVMVEKKFPVQTVVHGSLAGKKGCLEPLEDNAFTLLTGKTSGRNCQHVLLYGDNALRSACKEVRGLHGFAVSFY